MTIKIKHVEKRNEYLNVNTYVDSNGILWYKHKNLELDGIRTVKINSPEAKSNSQGYKWKLVKLTIKHR